MLRDAELNSAASVLRDARVHQEEYLNVHSNLIEKYSILLEEYKRLRSDYEEERDAREKYKRLAKGQDRDPFVLVLVDGDSYVFNDELISGGTEGGAHAAELLHNMIKATMRAKGLEDCHVMVRIYANLAGLSKTASKLSLCSGSIRSLAHFVASFNRCNELFDFVDAGWLSESADLKIRAVFNQFVNNSQCKHIVFAACHDAGYLPDLRRHTDVRHKITLIKNHSFHPDFAKLGFAVGELPGLFRSTSLRQPSKILTSDTSTGSDTTGSPIRASKPSKVCRYFQKSICKHGTKCRDLHVLARSSQSKSPPAESIAMQTSPIEGIEITTTRHEKSIVQENMADDTTSVSQIDHHLDLPQDGDFPSNQILLNKAGWRLDCGLPAITHTERQEFKLRVSQNKASGISRLCNMLHLQGECPSRGKCAFDHRPITSAVREGLRLATRREPCPRKGACRKPTCPYGHICQKSHCHMRGGQGKCFFVHAAHTTDLAIAKRVTIVRAGSEETVSTASIELETPGLIDDEEEAEYLSAPSLPDLFSIESINESMIDDKMMKQSTSISQSPQ